MMYREVLVLATPDSKSQPQEAKPTCGNASSAKPSNKPANSSRSNVARAQNDLSRLPAMVLAEQKPGKQKELASSVRFTADQLKTWESIKLDVVIQGNYCKFSQNVDLRRRLLDTGDRELVEASPMDDV